MKNNFAQNLSTALKEKGISRREFANIMGCSETTITNWCQQRNETSLANLIKISQALGITLERLLRG